jgi:RNA polymerase sigma-70 factor (ECF subfamily)
VEQSARDLTARIASGDDEAFTCFYRSWFDRMYAEARRLTGRDEAFCLDVVQDAMLRVIRKLKPLDGEAALAKWVRRTVRSCALDRLRADARRWRREQRTSPGPAPAAADLADLADRIRWVRRELRDLDEPARGLVFLRHGFELTLGQIGQATGLGPGAVDGRIRRALGAVRERAQEVDDD